MKFCGRERIVCGAGAAKARVGQSLPSLLHVIRPEYLPGWAEISTSSY